MQSPFGEAKPREVVIAQREGKAEDEVLKEEVKREKLRVRPLLNVFPSFLAVMWINLCAHDPRGWIVGSMHAIKRSLRILCVCV